MGCTASPWVLSVVIASLYLISYFENNLNVYLVYTYIVFLLALIALVVIVVSYVFIGLKMKQNNPSAQNKNRASRERKLAVTLLIVTLASLLTWLPHQCFLFVLYICSTCNIPHFNIFFIMKFLQFCNSGINVFIYIIRMPEFRQAFLALLCNKKQPTQQESTKQTSLSSVRQSDHTNGNQVKSIQKNQNQGNLTTHGQAQAVTTLNSRLNMNKANSASQNYSTNNKERVDNHLANDEKINERNESTNENFSKNGVSNVGYASDIDDTKL